MHSIILMNKHLRRILIIVFWLAIWQITAMIINQPILLASFTDTLKALFTSLKSADFYLSVFKTLSFTLIGLLLSYTLAILLAVLSYRNKLIQEFLSPLLSVMKAVPVASFAILVIIWLGNEFLTIFVSFIVVFPQIYFAVLNGLKNTDEKMLQAARIYRLSFKEKALYIYRLAIAPLILSASQSAIPMAFRSSIAAEVIGTTTRTIGQQLYYAKLYLDTAQLFSWTFVIILLSVLSEKALLYLLRRLGGNYHD